RCCGCPCTAGSHFQQPSDEGTEWLRTSLLCFLVVQFNLEIRESKSGELEPLDRSHYSSIRLRHQSYARLSPGLQQQHFSLHQSGGVFCTERVWGCMIWLGTCGNGAGIGMHRM